LWAKIFKSREREREVSKVGTPRCRANMLHGSV
jgi:hypothetical protein